MVEKKRALSDEVCNELSAGIARQIPNFRIVGSFVKKLQNLHNYDGIMEKPG